MAEGERTVRYFGGKARSASPGSGSGVGLFAVLWRRDCVVGVGYWGLRDLGISGGPYHRGGAPHGAVGGGGRRSISAGTWSPTHW